MQNYSNTINTSDNLHKYFNNGFSNFQEFQNDVFEKLDRSIESAKKGNIRSFDEFCTEMEEKYGLKKIRH